MILFLVSTSIIASEPTKNIALARSAAISWLKLIDKKKYSDSWKNSAALFKNSLTSEKWSSQVASVRQPIGPLLTRKELSSKVLDSAPGAPDGEYIVFTFKSSFTNKKNAIETVTPMKDKDGEWRVAGYYLK